MRAQGHNTHFAYCHSCRRRGKEKTTQGAAIATWNEDAERAAHLAEAKAKRQLKHLATHLRKDVRFIAAVLAHYLRRGALNGANVACQVMRMPVDGVDHEVNARAFVDGWLVPLWPELGTLADPEAVVLHVLADAGHGFRTVEGRVATGAYVGKWKRTEPHIGGPITIEHTGEQP